MPEETKAREPNKPTPQRQNVQTYETTEVQGVGSYVKVRAMTFGQSRQMRKIREGMTDEDKVNWSEKIIKQHVIDWNWVDDDGNPLPLPSEDDALMDRLTIPEVAFLGQVIRGELPEQVKP